MCAVFACGRCYSAPSVQLASALPVADGERQSVLLRTDTGRLDEAAAADIQASDADSV